MHSGVLHRNYSSMEVRKPALAHKKYTIPTIQANQYACDWGVASSLFCVRLSFNDARSTNQRPVKAPPMRTIYDVLDTIANDRPPSTEAVSPTSTDFVRSTRAGVKPASTSSSATPAMHSLLLPLLLLRLQRPWQPTASRAPSVCRPMRPSLPRRAHHHHHSRTTSRSETYGSGSTCRRPA